MDKLLMLYGKLLDLYGPQGWWPIVNDSTLVCEYHPSDYSFPRTDAERFEVCIGAILTQNTQWYPNVVRAIQQLKLGRPFTKEELELIEAAEIHKGIIREKPRKQTTGQILTQNTNLHPNVVNAIIQLKLGRVVADGIPVKMKGPSKIRKLNPRLILEENDLPSLIRPAGYYNQKADYLRNLAVFYRDCAVVPDRAALLKVKGIGLETADSMLLYAFGKPEFVVDAYTKRIVNHLGLIRKEGYGEVKACFEESLPKDVLLYREFHALLVEHAKLHYRKKPYSCPLK